MTGFGPVGGAGAAPEEDLQRWTRLHVWAGVLDDEALLAEVVSAIEAELPGIEASVLARAWIGGAQAELRRSAEGWPSPTEHERLLAALAECDEHGVPVLLGATPADARAEAERRTSARGVAWCAVDDVLAAVSSRVLRLELRHLDGSVAEAGDPLAGPVLACVERHGLRTRMHEGRWEVAVRWQRRVD
ncbi:hypothetical protein GCM10011519_07170 [Marmoricola endophyticus]|uniref:DUF6891 domain-containing protein n=1 Tax=Marmoricola endophyticus TaxID=2040280 RepID=A0A917BBQ9_9ACTN|nr:hypothetical protein [Marmoricola endophyticus]GGF36232.1 hypothetical protein GCM10011519_07170 [Marmoricola endophyticus]